MDELPQNGTDTNSQQQAVKKPETQNQKSKFVSLLIIGASIGFLISFPVIILLLLGMGADAIFHTGHTYAIAGAVVGFLGSFVNIYKFMKRIA